MPDRQRENNKHSTALVLQNHKLLKIKMIKKSIITTISTIALATLTSQAAIVFTSVAANLSNISSTTSVTGGGENRTNALWRQRDGFGESSITVLESWEGAGDEDVPVLTQVITGLTNGASYDVYVNYVRFGASGGDPDGDRGGIRGSLDNSTFTSFNAATGTAGSVGYSELTGFSNSDRVGLRGYLGTAVANASGEIQVYVDDSDDNSLEERVWYDGASYELVPEPSSTALLGLGGLALMIRRRR
ncbi:PEP-CTERM sorting domain-containing protein [Verrucomicrobiaceae bacterium N1E253]|uniref:PEP-CTERM sorting domain-containing protein n=1 Tax=Oceaniferula marina TaxID=2748318 RepID=A0A851GHC5_9BACT|nr:PEP-CTERM sorting domain-containing protein [Oceaniferula marina]NWK54527.1 PEP-CTERM sorting domain-containing protein [Oceaniferula marina]